MNEKEETFIEEISRPIMTGIIAAAIDAVRSNLIVFAIVAVGGGSYIVVRRRKRQLRKVRPIVIRHVHKY
jgi:hypothetical protein